MNRAAGRLADAGIIRRSPRFTTRKRREYPWIGSIVALDTEGSTDTGVYTATAQWDDIEGNVTRARFSKPGDFADFLIERSRYRFPTLMYFHNLEWDLQILWEWLGKSTSLQYQGHTARRNGSALTATWDYEGRHEKWRQITLRDSFAIYPMSLSEMGKMVGLPKLRTPTRYMPEMICYRTGRRIPHVPDEDQEWPLCDHGRVECDECYDLRDVDILHRSMRLYIAECDEAGVSPALTRSSHAMRDYRTNHMPRALHQYTERQNLRASLARAGGRTQMLVRGSIVAEPHEVIYQADVVSQYPSIMIAGRFPDADKHITLYNPKPEKMRTFVGWGWAEVTIPDMALGPLIVKDPRDGHASYPVARTVQGAWTTDELIYAHDLGCRVRVVRAEGTPEWGCIDPFSSFIGEKWKQRARHKAEGSPLERADKLTMNGLYGKFGMRWTDPIVAFSNVDVQRDVRSWLANAPCARADQLPARYPDYLMVPWAALILARARIMLHRYGVQLMDAGAQLLCCDTDSWTFKIERELLQVLSMSGFFGDELGNLKLEDDAYYAFRGAAPKEYALYRDVDEVVNREPYKCRAKGIGGMTGDRERKHAIDHYLRTGNVHFARPQKSRAIIRGGRAATFVHVEKSRGEPAAPLLPLLYTDFRALVRQQIAEVEDQRLWVKRERLRSEAEPATITA